MSDVPTSSDPDQPRGPAQPGQQPDRPPAEGAGGARAARPVDPRERLRASLASDPLAPLSPLDPTDPTAPAAGAVEPSGSGVPTGSSADSATGPVPSGGGRRRAEGGGRRASAPSRAGGRRAGGGRGDGAGGGGRRSAGGSPRRIDLLIGLALVLPSLVAAAVVVIGRQDSSLDALAGRGPTSAALTASTVVCPSALSARSAPVRVVRAPGVEGGELATRTAPAPGSAADAALGGAAQVAVPAGAGAVVPSSTGATVVEGRGAAAPGVVAGRRDRLAAPECATPGYDEWLVGLGASARYGTVIEIVNPDPGEAVVDIELHGAVGVIDEPQLRGVQVPGGGVRRIDLAAVAPSTEITAARVAVLRGRASVTARSTRDLLGRSRAVTDYQPSDVPARDRLILGVPARPTEATLYLANPGDDEVRVTPRLVTADAVFTAAGTEPVSVPPGGVAAVELTRVLRGDSAAGVVGLRLQSTGPVAASLRVVTAQGDLALLAPAIAVSDPAALVLPAGTASLVLGGLQRTGNVEVTAIGPSGAAAGTQTVELGADRTAVVRLPAQAVAVSVVSRAGPVSGVAAGVVGGRTGGLAVVRLRAPELRTEIPSVEPD